MQGKPKAETQQCARQKRSIDKMQCETNPIPSHHKSKYMLPEGYENRDNVLLHVKIN